MLYVPDSASVITWRGLTIPHFPARFGYVYLLCFSTAYKHAKHYLGSTGNLEARLACHKHGNGARLMEVVNQAGITWSVTRIWQCETPLEARVLESRLKAWHHDGRLCPHCQGKPPDALASLYYGHWPFHTFQVGKRQPLNEHRPAFVSRL